MALAGRTKICGNFRNVTFVPGGNSDEICNFSGVDIRALQTILGFKTQSFLRTELLDSSLTLYFSFPELSFATIQRRTIQGGMQSPRG